jgi:hypothetical protein
MGAWIKMNENDQNVWLDRQLREAAPYIDDEGFTARVLQRLPAPRRSRSSLRGVILLGMTVLASAMGYVLSDGGRFINEMFMRLAALPTLWVLLLALASGLLVTAVGVAAAISKTSELQS